MTSLRSTRLAVWTFAAVLGIALSLDAGWTWAQDKEMSLPAPAKKVSGRLPPYYSQVVTPQQREAIYRIQAEYTSRIAELQTRVDELAKERNDRVEALLTPEQRERLAKIKGLATVKRATKAAARLAENQAR